MAKPNRTNHGLQGSGAIFPFPESAVEVESTQVGDVAVALRETEFSILPDGRMVDLIRSTRQLGSLEYLVWNDGNMQVARDVEYEDRRLVVPSLDPTVVSALRLPTMAKPCPPIGELFMQLMQQIETYVDVSKEHNFLIAAFILSTWFADRLAIVPYLSVCGPPDSGQAKLLQLLHCLCRRAIHAADVTPASLYRLSAQVLPTWLIDEADFGNRRLQRLLRGGNQRDSRVLSNGKAFENFGPKVITSRVPLDDAALASSTVQIVMAPSSRDLATLDADAEQKLADAFQPMLEMFRLVHYRAVAASQYPGFLKFPLSLRDSARALAAPMLGNEELLEQLASALESQVDTARFERFAEPEYVVMLALFDLCHVASYEVYVGQVADEANRILHDGGERHQHSTKMVGSILNKSLGFPTRRRGEGYRIALTLGGPDEDSQPGQGHGTEAERYCPCDRRRIRICRPALQPLHGIWPNDGP
jgi:hypothetical protein